MASKFGILAPRIVGSLNYFVPDGSNIGTVEAPVLTGPTAKPADDDDWLDYFIGRMQKCAWDPKKGNRALEGFSTQTHSYLEDSQEYIAQDAFNLTLLETPSDLYDGMMYGLTAAIVANVAQRAFATAIREKQGWWRSIRYNEAPGGPVLLSKYDLHGRLKIGTAPEDSKDLSIPVLRWEHLGIATAALETVTLNPTEV